MKLKRLRITGQSCSLHQHLPPLPGIRSTKSPACPGKALTSDTFRPLHRILSLPKCPSTLFTWSALTHLLLQLDAPSFTMSPLQATPQPRTGTSQSPHSPQSPHGIVFVCFYFFYISRFGEVRGLKHKGKDWGNHEHWCIRFKSGETMPHPAPPLPIPREDFGATD